jgi:signal peptidase I
LRLGRLVAREILLPLVLALGLALVIQATVAKPYEIPTGSMIPTIEPDERVLANRFIYHLRDIQRGDIVVFRPPEALHSELPFVKRVVGLPGDSVEVRGGVVLVNGEPFEVELASAPTYSYFRKLVPRGMLFVLGDNRNNSVDSHKWGFLPVDNVLGEVFMTYWPLDRLRFL